MNNQRPHFEKKELALSSTPYVYLPVDLPAYTVEVCHRDEIDGDLLQRALDRTIQRMPYLADTLTVEGGCVYYAKNPLPMEAAHTARLRRVGGPETNYHQLDLTWDGNKTWFSMYHGFCDGQGINAFLESVLYHYYCMKDGIAYDPNGIRSDREEMSEAEVFEPFSKVYEVSPDFKPPEKREQPAPYHLPGFAPTPSTETRDHGFILPSREFMGFVKSNGTSPAVALSMLVGEAIRKVYPDAGPLINANIPLSARRMLGCEETFKNCSHRAVLPVCGTPLDAMPFAARAAALRGALKQQLNPDLMRTIYNYIGNLYRQRTANAVSYAEELKKPAGFLTICHDTFYVDYIGSLRDTGYADQITGVHFLCKPNNGSTPHLNIIEQRGRFQIDCLACYDIAALADALEEVFKAHGLSVQRVPERRFSLPLTAWRDGMEY